MQTHNPTIITLDIICNELAFIFDADAKYIERLFSLKRLGLQPIKSSKILKRQTKFSDIFDQSALSNCASKIFIAYGDEDDLTLKDMHAAFIAHIHEKYDGDADMYGEWIRVTCAKTYHMKDIIDYMCDELSDLQSELDGDVESESYDEEVNKDVDPSRQTCDKHGMKGCVCLFVGIQPPKESNITQKKLNITEKPAPTKNITEKPAPIKKTTKTAKK
jgi:hypothetical protein